MKIAHLILAHKNPGQLQMLLEALDHPAFDFYIHIDKKSDAGAFEYLVDNKRKFFVKKRASIYWAGWGTIQATINGFEEILPLNQYEYINVISAQDFPMKPAVEIYNFIYNRKGTEFITCEGLDTWKVEPRIRKYHLINWRIPGKYRLGDFVTKVLPARRFPFPVMVGRANWFTLTTKAAQFCLDYLKQHPAVIRYFKYCWGADEFIFSSILYNNGFRNNIEDNLFFVKWIEGKGHPEILTIDDYDTMIQSGKLFARKFDIQTDELILRKLSELVTVKN
ncbi:MAG: glycosyl transferase [Bacteroidetes bacterium]|nr:glycosyl transferase [Bacteroidota bacterium]